MQKADLQPATGKQPDHVALDETVIQLNDQRYWLYAAIEPQTNEFLHVKLYSTRTTALIEMFLSELREKHDVEDAVFLVDSARGSKMHSIILDSDFDTKNMEIGTPSNISSKM